MSSEKTNSHSPSRTRHGAAPHSAVSNGVAPHDAAPTSLAAVFRGAQQPLELTRLPLPVSLQAGEALVQVTCCTLCGSDLSTIAGHRQEPAPLILGHEIIGRIVALPQAATVDLRGRTVRLGERVVWSVAASCDQCRYCLRGLPQKCLKLRKYGHARLDESWQLSGGLSEYCHLVAGTKLVVVDEEISDQVLAPASCATATVAAALRTVASQLPGARVLILGAGLLGLTACAMARLAQAAEIAACDVSPARLRLAERFGAERVWLPHELAASDGARYDVILEMSGSPLAFQTAMAVADLGGSIVLVGAVRPTPAIELLPERVVRSVWSLYGVHNYRPQDLVTAVEFLEEHSHNFPFAEIVGAAYSLADIHRAVTATASAEIIRIAIHPGEHP